MNTRNRIDQGLAILGQRPGLWLGLFLAAWLAGGCSIRKLAMNKLGDALAQSGSAFGSDEDAELIRDAAPFSLKLMESVLAENPRHAGLLLAACRGFTQYAYAFVQSDAEEMEARDLAAANAARKRAARLYLRARNYGLRGLETAHTGWEQELRHHPSNAVQRLTRKDMPLMYWTALSWAAAIAQSKDNPDLIADLPVVEMLVDRAMKIDPDFNEGGLHSFMINFEFVRKNASGDPLPRVKAHFERAIALTHQQLAGPWINYAEAVFIQEQNAPKFKEYMERALAVNPDARPEWRLENQVMQRRARWLLSRLDELFIMENETDKTAK